MAKKRNYKNRYELDNMTVQQKDTAVKKINERYTDICRVFGPNSNTAQEYFNAMVLAFGAENMHTAAQRESKAKKRKTQTAGSMGIKLINRDKEMLKDIPSGNIQALLDRHTAGQIMKTVQREAKEESAETGGYVGEDDILSAMDQVNDFIVDHPDSDWYENYWNAVGGKGQGNPRPTYMTLSEMIFLYKQEKEREAAGDDNARKVWAGFESHWKSKAKTAIDTFFGD